MLLAVDIGNTNIVIAIYDGNDFVETFRIYSDEKKTSDEYMVILETLIRESGIERGRIDSAIVSSVVPNLTRSIEKIIKRLFLIEPLMVSKEIETGLNRNSIPDELGSDLLCNLSYAHHSYPGRTVMTVDFGTALTFSTVDGDGNVLGVSIAPGLVTAVNSLFSGTAQLPQVELKIPSSTLGRNSVDSIRSGIMLGYAGLVNSIIERTEKEVGKPLVVLATGGLSKVISPLIDRFETVDGYHTLRGLVLISSLNNH